MLLTGDIIEAGAVEHLGVFTETCAPDDGDGAGQVLGARRRPRCPPTASSSPRRRSGCVEQSQAYQGEEVASYLFHAYGTNLQFARGEFNFVKTRAAARHQGGVPAA